MTIDDPAVQAISGLQRERYELQAKVLRLNRLLGDFRTCDGCGHIYDRAGGAPCGCAVRRVEAQKNDLLAVCKEALPQLRWANGHGSRCDELIAEIEAAVAKAENANSD